MLHEGSLQEGAFGGFCVADVIAVKLVLGLVVGGGCVRNLGGLFVLFFVQNVL